MVERIICAGSGFAAVNAVAQSHRGFGPWISFKIADMLDRCTKEFVDFDQAAVFMFKDPREAALRLWRERNGFNEKAKPKDEQDVITQVVGYLRETFKNFTAPPSHERPVDLQEIETILCKWKSHMNGHYPLKNDITEIRHGLSPWAEAGQQAAKEFLEAMLS
jgi:hypothetical protein